MGNTQSAKTSKKKTLEEIVDYIASNYILTQNFKDMENLANMSYCNKLVILTSKIIFNNLSNLEIEFMTQRTQKGKEINEMTKDKLMFFQKDNLVNLDVTNKTQKRRMCIGLAKFYVKIAHIFAAIVTTINPIYTFNIEPSSSVISHEDDTIAKPDSVIGATTQGDATQGDATQGDATQGDATQGDATQGDATQGDATQGDTTQGDTTQGETKQDDELIKEVDLTQKHTLPENVKTNIQRFNICSQRINALINGEDYNVDENKEVKVNPNFCDINYDKNKSKPKTLFSEPGIPELEKLYFDKYDYDNGGFIGMTKDMRENVYEKDVETFYKVFTGNDTLPRGENITPVKRFSQIELHNYKKLEGCKPGGLYTKPYIGTLKDKLISKYAEHINLMMNKANKNQEKLFEYIDKLFAFNFNEQTKKKEIFINPNLTEKKLQTIVENVRKIIFELYKDCELDFSEGLKIFELMVEKTIKDTMVQQITNLEKDRDEILVGSDLSEKNNSNPELAKPLIPVSTMPEPAMPEFAKPLIPVSAMPEPAMPEFAKPLIPVSAMPEPAMPEFAKPLIPVSAMPETAMPETAMPEPAMPDKDKLNDIFSKPMIKLPSTTNEKYNLNP
jgi:hypothetical protein